MPRGPHALQLLATAGLGMLLGGSCNPARADEGYSRDEVIAAYLYRFTNYVDWPQQPRGGFVIDVYGDPGVARALRRLLPGHPIHSEIAEVREVRSARDIGDPQMLYVGEAHADFLRAVASDPARHVLMVSNEARGLDVGSALNFVTVDNRVRFEVSLTAADRAGIKISSELLSVAIRVHGGRRQSGAFINKFRHSPDARADVAFSPENCRHHEHRSHQNVWPAQPGHFIRAGRRSPARPLARGDHGQAVENARAGGDLPRTARRVPPLRPTAG